MSRYILLPAHEVRLLTQLAEITAAAIIRELDPAIPSDELADAREELATIHRIVSRHKVGAAAYREDGERATQERAAA
jgi:hypothetical protein